MIAAEAIDIIESDYYAREAEHEILADLGSSAFFGGAREPGDAMSIARMVFNEGRDLEADLAWNAQVREAEQALSFYMEIAPEMRS